MGKDKIIILFVIKNLFMISILKIIRQKDHLAGSAQFYEKIGEIEMTDT